MDEPTTTGTEATDTGADNAEPVTDASQPAASQPAEPQQTNEPAEPSADETSEWLQKKGIDPSDPEAVSKIAEMARNAEKKMHESTTKVSELEKSLRTDLQTAAQNGDEDAVQQLAAEVQSLKLTQNVNTFFNSGTPEEVADKKAFEPAMAAIVTSDPNIGQLVKGGYITYDQLYAMAKGGDTSREAQLKQDGGREALEKVADKQQARAINGSATTSALTQDVTKANVNEWYAGLSAAERAKPETQAVVNRLLS